MEVGRGKEAKPKILRENNIDKNKRKAEELKCHRRMAFLIGRKVIFL
ncbi:MAG: hypothetical protein M3R72_03195 [Bacteroidota bacterium]|nr:hypothetical protein [Bacteroidota bacterium]